MTKPKAREFTGRHMVMVMVAGFGIVMIVNFYMASLAVGGFHGIVVENSYVASQKFNGWLEEAEEMRALGWTASASRAADGHVTIIAKDVPEGAVITAELRRPIGEQKFATMTFAPVGQGQYRSLENVDSGRWTIRLQIAAQGKNWVEESELK
ncbi:MAG: FixH family protein [Erythrobacter sp.]